MPHGSSIFSLDTISIEINHNICAYTYLSDGSSENSSLTQTSSSSAVKSILAPEIGVGDQGLMVTHWSVVFK